MNLTFPFVCYTIPIVHNMVGGGRREMKYAVICALKFLQLRTFYCLVLLFISVGGCIFASGVKSKEPRQEFVPVPIIKLDEAIHHVRWSYDGSLFGYAEGTDIIIRDSNEYKTTQIIRPTLTDISGFIFSDIVGGSMVLSVSGDDGLMVNKINREEAGYLLQLSEDTDSPVTSFALDNQAGYIAAGLEDGSIELSLYLRFVDNLSRIVLQGHTSPIGALVFSPDGQWLASYSEDDKLVVWDARSGSKQGELDWIPPVPINANSSLLPLGVYGASSPKVIVAKDANTLRIYDMGLGNHKEIAVEEGIVGFQVNRSDTEVRILTEEQSIAFYDLETGKRLGYIPSFSASSMTGFAFNRFETKILVAHQDGSLFLLNIDEVFVPEREKEETYHLYLVKDDGSWQELMSLEELRALGIEPSDTVIRSYEGEGDVLWGEPFHSIDLLAGTTFLESPYAMSLDVQLGYANGFLIHPFYFGAFWRSSWGFPRSNFPYIYRIGKEVFEPPLLIDWVIEVPFGLRFVPWDFGLELFTEVSAGLAMHELWNRRTDELAITSGLQNGNFHGAFVTALTLGAGWKGILFKVSGEWDSLLGWSGQLSLGYSFRLPMEGDKE